MSRKKKTIDRIKLNNLTTKFYTSPISGATLSHPDHYPKLFNEVGFKQRNPRTNIFLGCVMTKPDSTRYVLGSSYYDLTEKKMNEDLFEIDSSQSTIEAHYRGSLDENDPLYRNTHKASKDYLLTGKKKIEIEIKKIIYELKKRLIR